MRLGFSSRQGGAVAHMRRRLIAPPARLSTSAAQSDSKPVAPGTREPDSLWAANRITLIGVGVNVASAVGKGVAGIYANSPGLLADAAHSVTDLLSDVVTLWAVNHARVPASNSTPWGLGKLESVGSSVCAGIITVTGLGVGAHSAFDLWEKMSVTYATSPHVASAVAAAATADMDGVLLIGLETRSATMVANAWHHRIDALSSVVALGGLAGTAAGMPMLDSLAGLAVAAMVTRVGVEMGFSALEELVDSQVERETLDQVTALIGSCPDVISTSHVRGRKLGPYVAIELRLQVPFHLSVSAAQQVATKAKLRVLEKMPEVYDVVISVDAERPVHTANPWSREIVVGSTVRPRNYELMRSHHLYDRDLRAGIVQHGLAGQGRVWGLSHVNVHWNTRKGGAIIEAALIIDPAMTVSGAHALAQRVRAGVLATVPDVIEVSGRAPRGRRQCAARELECVVSPRAPRALSLRPASPAHLRPALPLSSSPR
jgi:cation diffusion facilitator family transporter